MRLFEIKCKKIYGHCGLWKILPISVWRCLVVNHSPLWSLWIVENLTDQCVAMPCSESQPLMVTVDCGKSYRSVCGDAL